MDAYRHFHAPYTYTRKATAGGAPAGTRGFSSLRDIYLEHLPVALQPNTSTAQGTHSLPLPPGGHNRGAPAGSRLPDSHRSRVRERPTEDSADLEARAGERTQA